MDNVLLICHENFKKINKLFLEKNNINTLNIISLKYDLDNLLIESYSKYDSIFVILNESHLDEFFKNETFFYTKIIDSRIKFIYLDDAPEAGFHEEDILNFLSKSDRFYVITSRFINVKHDRLYNNLVYLPILFSFYYLNFSNFPKLDYSSPKNPKYNFITYLGHSHGSEVKIKKRFDFLKYILDEDLSSLKYKEYDNFVMSHATMGPQRMGHAWNLVNSFSAKIQLIFENMWHEPGSNTNGYFLTEKTMKLFLLPHPYIVFLPDFILESLKDYGFKFSYNGNDYKSLLMHVKEDIDGWITKNESDFYHNQTVFYNMVNSTELEHHLILEKIIKNEI